MKTIEITPAILEGQVDIPPSKSVCHRAIIAAALSQGQSTIHNVVMSDDIKATTSAVQAFGAHVAYQQDRLLITGAQVQYRDSCIINCMESGSTLRFLIPVGLLASKPVVYLGQGNLSKRPLGPYLEIFKQQDIHYSSDLLPMEIRGRLKPGNYELMGNVSSQFITGLMFALPLLSEASCIHVKGSFESKAYVDITIDTLRDFGISIQQQEENCFFVEGCQAYHPTDYTVEGDFSQAAFWFTAAALGGKISCRGLKANSKQGDKAILDILQSCGALVDFHDNIVTVAKAPLKFFEADVSQYPDLAPILAVLAALSEGTSIIRGAGRLRIKECDRLSAISTELQKLGAEVLEGQDSLKIRGRHQLTGGVVDSWGDHRIAMALAIAAIKCKNKVIIQNSEAVNKSYPTFYQDFKKLGGVLVERNLG